jgi:hypothetical protein
MSLNIYIFLLFVLFKCKNVKQKDPDQFFREMSHLKAHNFLIFCAPLLFVDHEFRTNPCPQGHFLVNKCIFFRRFFRDIQHDDPIMFGLEEFIEPDAKRLKRFLSSFINYWQLCNTQVGKIF